MKSLKEISDRLKIAKNKLDKSIIKDKNSNSSYIGIAFKISTEFVAAVVVGTTIGFTFDNLFGTKPWLIIIFFIIGALAGIINIIKSAKNMQRK
jgi:ATP synthase protein I